MKNFKQITESKIQIDISQFEVANYLVIVKAGNKYNISTVVKQ